MLFLVVNVFAVEYPLRHPPVQYVVSKRFFILFISDNHFIVSKVPLLALFEVFYYKMKGDYFRYIAEFTEGEGKTGAANSAHDACALFGISEAARLVCGDSSNILHSKAGEKCFRTSDCPICMDVCLAVFRRN